MMLPTYRTTYWRMYMTSIIFNDLNFVAFTCVFIDSVTYIVAKMTPV